MDLRVSSKKRRILQRKGEVNGRAKVPSDSAILATEIAAPLSTKTSVGGGRFTSTVEGR